MIRPLAQAGLNFLVYIYSFREYFIFYFFHERDSETFFFVRIDSGHTWNGPMGAQAQSRPGSSEEPTSLSWTERYCYCRVGWAPRWAIGRLGAPPRHLSCGPAWPSISSAFQPQELRIFGTFLSPFLSKK